MKSKVDEINIDQEISMFKTYYCFLNNNDFNKLSNKIGIDNIDDFNTIKIGSTLYIKFNGDLSDLGNDIGLNIGDYINTEYLGYEKDDFISGFKHGVSIIDGSHG